MFQKLAVVEALSPLTAAVVLEGVTADAPFVPLPGVVGAEAIPVFNASCEWLFLHPPELVEVVGTAVLLDVELELLACEPFDGDLSHADLGLNK